MKTIYIFSSRGSSKLPRANLREGLLRSETTPHQEGHTHTQAVTACCFSSVCAGGRTSCSSFSAGINTCSPTDTFTSMQQQFTSPSIHESIHIYSWRFNCALFLSLALPHCFSRYQSHSLNPFLCVCPLSMAHAGDRKARCVDLLVKPRSFPSQTVKARREVLQRVVQLQQT